MYNADGTLASGSILISWPAFTSADGFTITKGSLSAPIVNGAVSLELVPNAGATPTGTVYTARYSLKGGVNYTEYWTVPETGPVTVAAIRTTPLAATATTVAEHQITLGTGFQTFVWFWRRSTPPLPTGQGQCYWDTTAGTLKCSDASLAFQALGGGGSTPDATATTKGKLKLANDLGGTADLPTVVGVRAQKISQIIYADRYPSLQAAVDAAPQGARIIIPAKADGTAYSGTAVSRGNAGGETTVGPAGQLIIRGKAGLVLEGSGAIMEGSSGGTSITCNIANEACVKFDGSMEVDFHGFRVTQNNAGGDVVRVMWDWLNYPATFGGKRIHIHDNAFLSGRYGLWWGDDEIGTAPACGGSCQVSESWADHNEFANQTLAGIRITGRNSQNIHSTNNLFDNTVEGILVEISGSLASSSGDTFSCGWPTTEVPNNGCIHIKGGHPATIIAPIQVDNGAKYGIKLDGDALVVNIFGGQLHGAGVGGRAIYYTNSSEVKVWGTSLGGETIESASAGNVWPQIWSEAGQPPTLIINGATIPANQRHQQLAGSLFWLGNSTNLHIGPDPDDINGLVMNAGSSSGAPYSTAQKQFRMTPSTNTVNGELQFEGGIVARNQATDVKLPFIGFHQPDGTSWKFQTQAQGFKTGVNALGLFTDASAVWPPAKKYFEFDTNQEFSAGPLGAATASVNYGSAYIAHILSTWNGSAAASQFWHQSGVPEAGTNPKHWLTWLTGSSSPGASDDRLAISSAGELRIKASGKFAAIFDPVNLATAARTYTLPDASGTVGALTSVTANRCVRINAAGTALEPAAADCGAGGGAPTGATYITQTPDATLTAEQALSALATGLLKNTTGTGVLSIALAGTDYAAAAHAHAEADVTNLVTDLAAKEATANKNAASGYAGLTAATKLNAAQGQELWGVTDLTTYAAESGTGTDALRATIASPSSGQCLTWNGTNWVNGSCAGGSSNHNLLSATHPDTVAASPVLGDVLYANATPAWTKLAGNTTTAKQFLTQTGTGAVSAAPAWGAIADGDIPATITRDAEVNVQGTANQITSTGSGPAPVLAIANPFTFPGKATFAAGTTGAASANVPSGVAPTTPAAGDLWNESGLLKFMATATETLLFQSRTVNANAPLAGGGALTADLTLTCTTCEVTTNKNAASGYAGLTASSKLTAAQGQEVWALADLTDVSAVTGTGSTVVMSTSPTITTPTISGALGGNLDLGAAGRAVLTEVANEGVTGTTVNLLAKLTGAPSTAVKAAITDTGGVIGVVAAGAGTTGNAQIAVSGRAGCTFDGATTAGNYVKISSTTAGNCSDAGATYPTSGQVLGRVLSTNGAGGTYDMEIFGPEIKAAAAGGGDSVTVNGAAVTDADLDDATPAAGVGKRNVAWQKDASSPANISAQVAVNMLLDRQQSTAAITGDATDKTIYTYTLPGGTMAANKCIRVTARWRHSTGTVSTTYKFWFGATSFSKASTAGGNSAMFTVCNNSGSTTAQEMDYLYWQQGSAVLSLEVVTAAAENTASDVVVKLTFNVAATDQVTGINWLVELVQ